MVASTYSRFSKRIYTLLYLAVSVFILLAHVRKVMHNLSQWPWLQAREQPVLECVGSAPRASPLKACYGRSIPSAGTWER